MIGGFSDAPYKSATNTTNGEENGKKTGGLSIEERGKNIRGAHKRSWGKT